MKSWRAVKQEYENLTASRLIRESAGLQERDRRERVYSYKARRASCSAQKDSLKKRIVSKIGECVSWQFTEEQDLQLKLYL